MGITLSIAVLICIFMMTNSEKQESSRKISTSALLTMPRPLTLWITTNLEKFFKRCEMRLQDHLTCFLRNLYAGKKETVRTRHGTIVQFHSVPQSCLTFCDPKNHNTPGLPVHHHLPELMQTHVHIISDAI